MVGEKIENKTGDVLIKISRETWKKLNMMKLHGDTFNSVIKKLIDKEEKIKK